MFAKNLKFLREKNGLEQIELANRLGRKSSSSVSEWEKGKYTPKMGTISDIAKIFDISISDLMDKDLSISDTSIPTRVSEIVNDLKESRQKKVLKYAQSQLKQQNNNQIIKFPPKKLTTGRATAAGNPIDGATEDTNISTTVFNQMDVPSGADEIVTVAGDSMEPTYPEGSQVFVHWQPEIEQGEVAIVAVKDEGVTCKKVYFDQENGKIILRSINENYEDRVLNAEDVRVIGRVI